MIRHYLTKQFLTFLLVGSLAGLANWISCVFINHWCSFSTAVVFSYLIGMLTAFILNHKFVFPNSSKTLYAQATHFIIVNLSFIPIVWLVSTRVDVFLRSLAIVNYSKELAHAIGIGFPMLITFLLYKFFAFKEKTIT